MKKKYYELNRLLEELIRHDFWVRKKDIGDTLEKIMDWTKILKSMKYVRE